MAQKKLARFKRRRQQQDRRRPRQLPKRRQKQRRGSRAGLFTAPDGTVFIDVDAYRSHVMGLTLEKHENSRKVAHMNPGNGASGHASTAKSSSRFPLRDGDSGREQTSPALEKRRRHRVSVAARTSRATASKGQDIRLLLRVARHIVADHMNKIIRDPRDRYRLPNTLRDLESRPQLLQKIVLTALRDPHCFPPAEPTQIRRVELMSTTISAVNATSDKTDSMLKPQIEILRRMLLRVAPSLDPKRKTKTTNKKSGKQSGTKFGKTRNDDQQRIFNGRGNKEIPCNQLLRETMSMALSADPPPFVLNRCKSKLALSSTASSSSPSSSFEQTTAKTSYLDILETTASALQPDVRALRKKQLEEVFFAYDFNGDGYLSYEELAALIENIAPKDNDTLTNGQKINGFTSDTAEVPAIVARMTRSASHVPTHVTLTQFVREILIDTSIFSSDEFDSIIESLMLMQRARHRFPKLANTAAFSDDPPQSSSTRRRQSPIDAWTEKIDTIQGPEDSGSERHTNEDNKAWMEEFHRPSLLKSNLQGSTNVIVAVRLRPWLPAELRKYPRERKDHSNSTSTADCVVQVLEGEAVRTVHPSDTQRVNNFVFDYAFDSRQVRCREKHENNIVADQRHVFDMIGMNTLRNAWCGYNVCLFAYGQTGSGKSYTITGPGGGVDRSNRKEEGLVPRICRRLFDLLANSAADAHAINNSASFSSFSGSDAYVELSFLELYNEKLKDLLAGPSTKDNNDRPAPYVSEKSQLKVVEQPLVGVTIRGLTKHVVSSFEDVAALLADGNRIRAMAATAKNATSSRSHAICQLCITRTVNEGASQTVLRSKVNIIDLAGSENASVHNASYERSRSRHGSFADWNKRVAESAAINKSLLTLGACIKRLVEIGSTATAGLNKAEEQEGNNASNLHVPYRSSVLTHLLKNSLGGNSKTTMIATISPNPTDYASTLNTLRYADRAKQIRTYAVVNQTHQTKLMNGLKEEIVRLKALLRSRIGEESTLRDELSAVRAELDENSMSLALKRRRTVIRGQERQRELASMGFAIDANSLTELQSSIPHLVNVSEDPLMSEVLLFPCREGTTRVGSGGNNDDSREGSHSYTPQQDICLKGLQILDEHALLLNTRGEVSLHAVDSARIFVNDTAVTPATGPRKLQHGDWIVFGFNHVYRFKDPLNRNKNIADNDAPRSYADVIRAARMATMGLRMSSSDKVNSKLGSEDTDNLSDALRKGWALASEANAIARSMRLGNAFSVSLVVTPGNNSLVGRGPKTLPTGASSQVKAGELKNYRLDVLNMLDCGVPDVQVSAFYTVSGTRETDDQKQSNPIFFTCTVPQFEDALIHLRKLYEREVVVSRSRAESHNRSNKRGRMREKSMLSSPIDVVNGSRADSSTENIDCSSSEEDYYCGSSDEESDAAEDSTAGTENGLRARRPHRTSTVPAYLSDRLTRAYLQCFRAAGIDQLHLRGFLQKFVESNGVSRDLHATPGTAAVSQFRQRDETLDPLLDPEDGRMAGLTPSKHLVTLIQENARMAHLLRTKTREEEKAIAERATQSWPAKFPADPDSPRLDYFAPSLKVFSEMLDHDLRAAAERSLQAFSIR